MNAIKENASTYDSLSETELLEAIRENPALAKILGKYIQISQAKTGVRDINQIEYDICDVSEELNKQALGSWLEKQQRNAELTLRMNKGVKRSVKKKLCWHSSLGGVTVSEQVFRNSLGKIERPLQSYCGISQRGYSFKLQRMITHAGCEESFDQAVIHLKELANLSLSKTEIRRYTLLHAVNAANFLSYVDLCDESTAHTVLSQIDGSMLPLIERPDNLPEGSDKRLHKKRIYKEIRLAYGCNKDSGKYFYQADFVYKEQIKGLLETVLDKVNFKHDQSQLYAMGDGAKWIMNTYKAIDDKVKYTVDYYHLSEFISPVLDYFPPGSIERKFIPKEQWLTSFHKLAATNKLIPWLRLLLEYWEGESMDQITTYFGSRKGCFDYKTLIDKDIPVGAGLIEGAHKFILQQRLKKSGVGWEFKNIRSMVKLRLLSANDLWDQYWDCQWLNQRVAA